MSGLPTISGDLQDLIDVKFGLFWSQLGQNESNVSQCKLLGFKTEVFVLLCPINTVPPASLIKIDQATTSQIYGEAINEYDKLPEAVIAIS